VANGRDAYKDRGDCEAYIAIDHGLLEARTPNREMSSPPLSAVRFNGDGGYGSRGCEERKERCLTRARMVTCGVQN